jgi:hypothetical protein
MEHRPPPSTFGERLVTCNGLERSGFRQWVFLPGMLFGSLETWWGRRRTRQRPHEGLDLCLYRDQSGRVRSLGRSVAVPVIYGGEVTAVRQDFLGQSVFLEHAIHDGEGRRLFTAYGHVVPGEDIRVGRAVDEGDVVATLAEPRDGRSGAPTHLHLSVAWVRLSVPGEGLDWEMMADPRQATLLDPLDIASLDYVVVEDAGGV